MAEGVSRILVIKLSALGDLFHAVPVVHALAEQTGARVDWVTQGEYAELAGCHADVDRVLVYPRRGGVGAWGAFVRALRRERYDWVIDLQGLLKSGVVMGLARGGRKIGLREPREGSGWFAHEIPVRRAEGDHAMERLADTVRHLGLVWGEPVYPLRFPEAGALPGGRPRLGIAPVSRWPAKDWPLEKFVAVVEGLRGRGAEFEVVVFGGPKDREAGERMVAALGEGVWNWCGQSGLLQLGSQLKEVDVLLCNDSGPMHFAAAVGTPVVALFGPTDPGLTGPVGAGHRVIRPEPGAEGYPPHRSYRQPGNAFIARIEVETVVEALWSHLVRC